MNFIDKDLSSVQEARILAENAAATQRLLLAYETKFFDKAFDSVYKCIDQNLNQLSKMYVEESGYGNYEDTYKISKLFLDELYHQVQGKDFIGELKDDTKIGVPMGGIILIPAPRNTLLSMINVILLAIKTGNVLIIATEKRVQKFTQKFVEITRRALLAEDYPQDFVSCFKESCSEGIKEILKSKKLAVIINAGNKEYLPECIVAGKIFYYGSTGASPVFVERSADVKSAIKDIVSSRNFNHGILPGAEQFLVVDEPIIEKVNTELKNNFCYFMNPEEEKKLLKVLIQKDKMDEEKIGKSAYHLAVEAGFNVPLKTTLLVSYQEYISEVNSYTKELNVPVLVVYKESDWLHACEKCIKILTREHDGHSLSIYSNDSEIIKQFIYKKPVGRVMVNTNTSFSAMGIGSQIYPSAILGAFTRSLGILSSNLKPNDLVYLRDIVRVVETEIGLKESKEYMVDDFLALFAKIIEK